VFTTASAASTLLELEDRDRLEVRLVEIEPLTRLSALSSEEELPESWFEEVLMAVSVASTLDDEFDRLRLEV
jgi:hypothetical protein